MALALAGACAVWLLAGLPDARQGFILHLRAVRLAGLVYVGAAIGVATVLLQTVAGNRVLTPSMLGFDALYALIQTLLVAGLGIAGFAALGSGPRFAIALAAMAGLGTLMIAALLRRPDLPRLILGGIILGVLFRSLAGVVTRTMDPNAFAVVQSVSAASFTRIDAGLLPWAGAVLLGGCAIALARARQLDVLALGRGVAVPLGLPVDRLVLQLLALVAALSATATALVGPMALFGGVSFFGLIVAGLAHGLAGRARHAVLLPAAALIGALILVAGQLLFERLLAQAGTLSMVIEFAGGLVFLSLLLKGRIR